MAAAGSRDATGVQPAHTPRVGFVARHMVWPCSTTSAPPGVLAGGTWTRTNRTLTRSRRSSRGQAGLQSQLPSTTRMGSPSCSQPRQRRRITHVTQMPDLIGAAQPLRQSGGAMVMRVGKNGYPHSGKKSERWAFGKDGLHAGLTPAPSCVVLARMSHTLFDSLRADCRLTAGRARWPAHPGYRQNRPQNAPQENGQDSKALLSQPSFHSHARSHCLSSEGRFCISPHIL